MADESPRGIAELKVAGVYYGGWKLVRVSRSIEQMAGSFELEITERWPGRPETSPIKPGEACVLYLDGTPVITGYVDTVVVDVDAGNHTIRVSGRDKTADLVDCSAMYKTGQWRNVKLDRIAADLLKPYLIKIVVETDVGSAFSSFSIQEGESIFECLERAARQKAVLLTSNAAGDLVITRAGLKSAEAALREGVNIKAARAEFSWKDRHSFYVVKGQGRLGSSGDQVHAAPSGKSFDEVIDRHRPLVILGETHGVNSSLADRAEWERNVRRGRSARGSITVQGWRHAGGLWQPNIRVSVTAPLLWLTAAEMLVVGCTYTLDDRGGTLTELAIAKPEAFQLLAGVSQSKLFGKLKSKEQREKREKSEDWSML